MYSQVQPSGESLQITWPFSDLKMASSNLENDDEAATSIGLSREDGEWLCLKELVIYCNARIICH